MRATLFLLLMASMPLANAAGMMDTLVSQVQSASGGWMAGALGYATNLFFGLAAIEFAWSAIQLTLKKSELSEIMVGTLFKVMSLSFFAMVLIKAPEWIPAIVNSFKAAGAGVGGTTVLSPSAVFDQGLQVAASAQDAVQGRSYFYHAVIDGADLTIAIERVLGKWSVTECVGINNRKLSDRELRIVHGWAAAILH